MTSNRRSVVLIAAGVTGRNLPLQPWRFLIESGRQLAVRGREVHLVSDGLEQAGAQDELCDLPVWRLRSVSNPLWHPNRELYRLVEKLNPSTVLWHMGLTSLLHQRYALPGNVPIVGIFTSPIYRLSQLLQLGLPRLVAGYRLSAVHLLGALIPRRLLHHLLHGSNVRHMVVQSKTLARQLRRTGIWGGPIRVIQPGVDAVWHPQAPENVAAVRARLGYEPGDKVLVYFGSPAPLRGLHTLLRAFALARQDDNGLKLLVLSRRQVDELARQDAAFRRLLQNSAVSHHVQVIGGFLPKERLVSYVAAADVVVLPFELVPSDAPLSLFETQALGKPIVTTNVSCLPEIVGCSDNNFTSPGDAAALAGAIERQLLAQSQRSEGHRGRNLNGSTRTSPRRWKQVGIDWSSLV